MRRLLILPVLALAVLLGGAAGQQSAPEWMKLDYAKALSTQTGKLILAYIACDPQTGMSKSCGNGGTDRAFTDSALSKRLEAFYPVRVCDKKTALDLRATKALEVLFLDGDGDEVTRGAFGDARSLETLLKAAEQRYVSKEIAWAAKAPAADSERRPSLLVFADERKDSLETLKALEDRTLVKYQERFHFVKLAGKRDAEEARRWGVVALPTVLILDPLKPEVLERSSGRRSPRELKGLITKALGKLDAKK